MMKTFKVKAAEPGRGYIFTVEEVPTIRLYAELNTLAIMKSSPFKAPYQWEINPKEYNQALAVLQEYGYTKEDESHN